MTKQQMHTPLDISGTTRIYPVLADPVAQLKAPALFNAYFKRHGIDARVVPFKVAPAAYPATARALMQIENVGGIFVSIPHKPASLELVDRPTERALLAGACNVIYRAGEDALAGDLIDGEGFIRAFDRTLGSDVFAWAESSALVVGAGGGVGSAVAQALAARGIGQLALSDTRPRQVAALIERLQAAYPATRFVLAAPSAAGHDLLVNATPLGMHESDPLPLDLTGIAAACIVADCGMKIAQTRLLREAAQRGCRIQLGREMLIEQAPLYLECFGWPGVASDAFRSLAAI
ncbi:MAG: shikimate dehydrogenase [Pseudomonadota bacterium]